MKRTNGGDNGSLEFERILMIREALVWSEGCLLANKGFGALEESLDVQA